MNSIDRIIFKNNDIPTTYLISNSIEGYLNTTDGKFYKESSYTTEIAGAATVLYLDKATNKLYRYNESNHQYIAIAGGGSSITIDDEIDSSSTNPVQNKVIYSALEDKIDNSLKGANNGIAELDSNGKLDSSQLPLGEASSTAYRGDRGKTAYDHSQVTSGNPHNVTALEVGAYTKSEVDNKISTLETNIDWKETVATFSDIATTYPNPVDGWTVNVKDTDYTYRYNGSAWVAISANAIPQATTSVNGLMTTTQVTKLDGIATGAEVNVQSDWDVTDSSSDAFIKNKPTIPDVSTKMDKANPIGTGSFSLNRNSYGTTGSYSFVEGYQCIGSGNSSHAEGFSTIASAQGSHSEGAGTTASGIDSHAEGTETEASANHAHAEGSSTKASGSASHAEGYDTVAGYNFQHVGGKFNDNKATTLFEIGNGTDDNTRSNAFEVYNDGSLSTDNGTTKVKLENLVSQSEPIENTVDFTDVISITDALPVNANDVKLKIEVVQDLHGYNNPWVGGAGKNVLPITISSQTKNGVTLTVNADKSITVSTAAGGATDTAIFNICEGYSLEAGTYIYSGVPATGSSTSTYYLDMRTDTSSQFFIDSSRPEREITTAGQSGNDARLIVMSGVVITTPIVFKPMIRLASITDPTYEPYENICPISGWDNAKVTRSGKNKCENIRTAPVIRAHVTFTPQSDGTIAVSGTPDAIAYYEFLKVHAKSGTYKLTGLENTTNLIWEKLQYYNDGAYSQVLDLTSLNPRQENTITIANDYPDNDTQYLVLSVKRNNNGVACTGTIKAMVREPNTDITWEPYQCEELTISLNGTRYGGTLDVTSGVLTIDRAIAIVDGDVYDLHYGGAFDTGIVEGRIYFSDKKPGYTNFITNEFEVYQYGNNPTVYGQAKGSPNISNIWFTLPSTIISKSDLVTWLASNPIQIVYELATPQTIQLTPAEVKLLQGYNTLFADTGDIQLTYNPATYGNIVEEVGELEERVSEVEGDIATIEDDVTTHGSQIQALTNYVAENNVKNILPNDKTSQTVDGVTFTVNSDGSVTANGTATSTIYYRVLYILNNYLLTAGKQYKLSGCPAGGGNNTYKLQAEMNGQTIANSEDTGNGATFTAPEFNTRFAIYIRIPNGYTISNQLFKPMITDANIPNSDYAHYQPHAKTNVELTQDVSDVLPIVGDAIEITTTESFANLKNGITYKFPVLDTGNPFEGYSVAVIVAKAASTSGVQIAFKVVSEANTNLDLVAVRPCLSGTYGPWRKFSGVIST